MNIIILDDDFLLDMTGLTHRETLPKAEPAKELVRKRALVAEAGLCAATFQYATVPMELFHPQLPTKVTARNLCCWSRMGLRLLWTVLATMLPSFSLRIGQPAELRRPDLLTHSHGSKYLEQPHG